MFCVAFPSIIRKKKRGIYLKVLLTTLNATYIHKNLALRWLYQACPEPITPTLWEFTLRDDMESIIERLCEGNFDIICFSVYIWNI